MRENKKWFLLLHLFLIVYALGSVCSKLASYYEIGSFMFFALYGGVIASMGIYAVGWQQIIKHLPLTNAYANKAITVVWGMVFGVAFFRESIFFRQVLAVVIIIAGIILYIMADGEESA